MEIENRHHRKMKKGTTVKAGETKKFKFEYSEDKDSKNKAAADRDDFKDRADKAKKELKKEGDKVFITSTTEGGKFVVNVSNRTGKPISIPSVWHFVLCSGLRLLLPGSGIVVSFVER